jgi:hypothetical protein
MTVMQLIAQLQQLPPEAEVRCVGPDAGGFDAILCYADRAVLITEPKIPWGATTDSLDEQDADDEKSPNCWNGTPFVMIVPKEDKW